MRELKYVLVTSSSIKSSGRCCPAFEARSCLDDLNVDGAQPSLVPTVLK